MSSYLQYKKIRSSEYHTDDWLMTYADIITLLLCFFAIFLSTSVPRKQLILDTKHQMVLQEPTKLKDIFEGRLPFHGVPRTSVPTLAQAGENDVDDVAVVIDEAAMFAAAIEFNMIEPSATEGIIIAEPESDRITTLEMNSSAFFDSGSAILSSGGQFLLIELAENIMSEEYAGYHVTVEGHTDDSPIATERFPSNWELSTARASAVVKFFLEQNIPAERLRAAGYADTFPKVPNRDVWNHAIPENQAQNRRVVIKLEKIDKAS